MSRPALGARVHEVGSVESTQRVLATLAEAGAPEGTVVRAEHQTAGRGRLGRAWWDAPGQSVLASILLRPPIPLARASGLSLVTAVAAADALDGFGVPARIRWPNDLMVDERKLGGILCEVPSSGGAGEGRAAGPMVVVLVGVGINVAQAAFPEPIGRIATSIRLVTGRTVAVRDVLTAVLAALDARYRVFLAEGLGETAAAWRRRSATLGRRVRTPEGEATAVDLDDDGALLVTGGDGRTRRVSAGEIAHAPGD